MTATQGSNVKVHYTGTFLDGEIFDSSEGREPLDFTVGAGMMIAGFDKAVDGMAVGEKKKVTIPAQDAYGEADQNLIFKVPADQIQGEGQPQVGEQIMVRFENGEEMPFMIVDVTESEYTLDGNHPLSGKDLIFDIELVSVA